MSSRIGGTVAARAALNGAVCMVVRPADADERAALRAKGRVKVQLRGGKCLSVRPANLRAARDRESNLF